LSFSSTNFPFWSNKANLNLLLPNEWSEEITMTDKLLSVNSELLEHEIVNIINERMVAK